MIKVIEEEFRLVRQLVRREGATVHEPLDDTRVKTSHQTPEIVPLKPMP
jgi:hypothetical protein